METKPGQKIGLQDKEMNRRQVEAVAQYRQGWRRLVRGLCPTLLTGGGLVQR